MVERHIPFTWSMVFVGHLLSLHWGRVSYSHIVLFGHSGKRQIDPQDILPALCNYLQEYLSLQAPLMLMADLLWTPNLLCSCPPWVNFPLTDRFLSRHHCYSWIASLSGSGNVFFPFSSHRIWPSGFPFSDACICPSDTWWTLLQQKWLPAFPGSLWFSCSFWDHGLPICIPCRQHPNPVVSICLHHQIWFLCQHTIPICLHHLGWPPL